ncbi:MAG: PglZ domain-containing protein [Candidatus Coatesbacteria bacterium]|nr:MAG: PglZ domain-containing protein [Candidatus Coatesbacteria bacterium]RLC43366.1 MAG: PglZ domain-containing protein [Candidatus Coatesbacteria bacterium]
MLDKAYKILWVDDEIDHLTSHIFFLQKKGLQVETATSGREAINLISEKKYDAILLDEFMMDIDGMEVLERIRRTSPALPVIMVTKSEEEHIMDEGFALNLDDYLIKPVNPKQVIACLKRHLEGSRLKHSRISRSFGRYYNSINLRINDITDWRDWIDIFIDISRWDIDLSDPSLSGVSDLKSLQKNICEEADAIFSEYYSRNYTHWLKSKIGERPILSPDIIPTFTLPLLEKYKSVFFIVIDCLRLDQWLLIETELERMFRLKRDYYFSIIPTSTVYSRNAIFSGLLPVDLQRAEPNYWLESSTEEESLNKYEGELLKKMLEQHNAYINNPRYIKISNKVDDDNLRRRMPSIKSDGLTALVFNFVDTLTHERDKQKIIEEIARDTAALREVVKSWFLRSSLMELLNHLSEEKDTCIVITSDHGSISTERSITAYCDKDSVKSLRFWFGRNLRFDGNKGLLIRKPEEWGLPNDFVGKNYIIAKENYNFIFSFDYHHQKRRYEGAFQHGGISMPEIILPCTILEPKV